MKELPSDRRLFGVKVNIFRKKGIARHAVIDNRRKRIMLLNGFGSPAATSRAPGPPFAAWLVLTCEACSKPTAPQPWLPC
jgi:hypothetical protein